MKHTLIETFIRHWGAFGGSWERHENAVAARLALLRYLYEQRKTNLLSWDANAIPIPGIASALQDSGFNLMTPHRRNLNPDLALGLTSADAALAETASLVFITAPGRSWLPAMIPIRHVVLLPTSRLYPDLQAWRQAWSALRAYDFSQSLIVTGPSISDDIELYPHRGMFGPRKMHIILFED